MKTQNKPVRPKRRRRPIRIAVVDAPRRSAGKCLLPILFLLVVGVTTAVLSDESRSAGDRRTTVHDRPVTVATAAAHDVIPPVDVLPDGRRLASASRRRPRRGSRRNEKLEREREERRRKQEEEIDRIHAEYWAQAANKKSWSIGTAYARFSTRFQESIGDQIRKILEFALANEIRVPRDRIFFDLAVRGAKNRRVGLDAVRAVLRTRKANVLLLFATNRLFRRTYMTLQFVDTVHRELQARCIFVATGIDTNNKDQWEGLLHLHAMMDQFVVRVGIAHIHAAHEGMLSKRIVFGSLSYGYGGRPIPGEFTKQKKPRCEIVVDEATAVVVRQIFHWYVRDRVDIIEIVRRLKADPSIPLPPRAHSKRWTRGVVRNILKNTRYRGLWRYGVTESVFLPEADYVRQRPRVEPLKQVQLEELRIVDDALWYAAQERLASERGDRRGRPPVDGDHESRPKLVNGLLVCPTHEDQPLYVGGPYGNAMVCPLCRAMPAEERPLYTILNRQLATELLIAKIVELLAGDEALIAESIAVCRAAAEGAQRPDPQAVARLRNELAQIDRAVNMTRRTVGESPEEHETAERMIRELQGEAAGVRAELARLEAADRRIPRVPTADEVRALLNEAAERLTAAAGSDDAEVIAQGRRLLELVTGGRIELEQQGAREPKKGWLRGRFRVRLLSYLVEQCGGEAAADDGVEVTVDFRRPSPLDAKAEQAWNWKQEARLKGEELPNTEIAKRLGCGRSMVTKLLKHAAALHGVPYEDGRSCRPKGRTPWKHLDKVEEVGRMVDEGLLLAEIADRLELDRNDVTRAYNLYREQQGLPPLDGRARRKLLERKNRPPSDDVQS